MKNVTTKAAMEYVETLHQRSNDARYMSICEKVNEAKRALIKERDELESKCNAYDTDENETLHELRNALAEDE